MATFSLRFGRQREKARLRQRRLFAERRTSGGSWEESGAGESGRFAAEELVLLTLWTHEKLSARRIVAQSSANCATLRTEAGTKKGGRRGDWRVSRRAAETKQGCIASSAETGSQGVLVIENKTVCPSPSGARGRNRSGGEKILAASRTPWRNGCQQAGVCGINVASPSNSYVATPHLRRVDPRICRGLPGSSRRRSCGRAAGGD